MDGGGLDAQAQRVEHACRLGEQVVGARGVDGQQRRAGALGVGAVVELDADVGGGPGSGGLERGGGARGRRGVGGGGAAVRSAFWCRRKEERHDFKGATVASTLALATTLAPATPRLLLLLLLQLPTHACAHADTCDWRSGAL